MSLGFLRFSDTPVAGTRKMYLYVLLAVAAVVTALPSPSSQKKGGHDEEHPFVMPEPRLQPFSELGEQQPFGRQGGPFRKDKGQGPPQGGPPGGGPPGGQGPQGGPPGGGPPGGQGPLREDHQEVDHLEDRDLREDHLELLHLWDKGTYHEGPPKVGPSSEQGFQQGRQPGGEPKH
ncbi:hypothetical protein TELCIR_16825 [Teladorsagia circumcincta]|uniref:Uncharacterized protein n=1 Tax=Teladorsagia circumcincta TaxID=45464 RepID=A0A2G9TUP1_TELCI|nr:hypothetical protein TELCIR_16825 [Teladorsagia circumcincta]